MTNSEHKPFISPGQHLPEISFVPILMGIIFGIVFGASSLYLALKVGMTVSASIPVAVLSITLFRALSRIFGLRRATILENNLVQTTGSAGESIAFGIAVTMPALLILGYEMQLGRIMLVAVLGSLLGVLMMIPLRHAMIVKEHGKLSYPEGTACAEVLIVGEKGGTSAKTVFSGFFLGLFYKFFNSGMGLWKEVPERAFSWFKGAGISGEISPELMGVGYIIGSRIACIMVAGGILSSWVLTPMIKLFGDGLPQPLFPATELISKMSPHEIWLNYVLYIGAGAVAAGGMISLGQSLPTIIRSALSAFSSLRAGRIESKGMKRTEQDIPMPYVFMGCILLVFGIWLSPSLKMNLLGAILIVSFGFLFVTVSSRLVGEIGSSSNPISGMTVATLLLTSLVFLGMGWVALPYRVTALSVAAIVCVAASNAGATSQDLKTGFLVGATPKYQQIGLLFGALTSALVIGYTLNLLNDASTVYSKTGIPGGARVDNISLLTETETIRGPEGAKDHALYHVLQLPEPPATGALSKLKSGKYLVDNDGVVQYLVDPGINGRLDHRDDGTPVLKYTAPKARLMSMIIDGILARKLPWGLVLLGVSLSLILELCGVSSLPFAVGVYLPLSSSTPIFAGGLIRYLTDYQKGKSKSEEIESSPGVLFSSGLIAGGSIAGIGLAILSLKEDWQAHLNMGNRIPSFSNSDGVALMLFVFLGWVLFKVGCGNSRKNGLFRKLLSFG